MGRADAALALASVAPLYLLREGGDWGYWDDAGWGEEDEWYDRKEASTGREGQKNCREDRQAQLTTEENMYKQTKQQQLPEALAKLGPQEGLEGCNERALLKCLQYLTSESSIPLQSSKVKHNIDALSCELASRKTSSETRKSSKGSRKASGSKPATGELKRGQSCQSDVFILDESTSSPTAFSSIPGTSSGKSSVLSRSPSSTSFKATALNSLANCGSSTSTDEFDLGDVSSDMINKLKLESSRAK